MLTLDATAAMEQRANVSFNGTIADKLVADKVCVMRRRDVIVPERPVHVMVN